jgi:hypothetical protein
VTEGANNNRDDLTTQLRSLRVDSPASDFAARLRIRLAEAGPPPRPGWMARLRALGERRRAWVWSLGGALAGAATFALFALVLDRAPTITTTTPGTPAPAPLAVTRGEVPPTFVVPSAKVAVIKLAFSADVDVEDVTFEINLPEGLAFWSHGQALPERSFRWPGRLAAGENLFPVAVRGERPGLYRVKARAEVPGEAAPVEHEIWLEVRGTSG